MGMPKPTDAHRRLASLAGDWVGPETLHPSPWSSETRMAVGRFHMRMAVDGMFLINDYEEERDAMVVFRGHGVYGWDPERERFTMYWVDSMGATPSGTTGVWQDNALVFSNRGERGHTRYTYTLVDSDHLRFAIETSRDGELWTAMMDGDFRRVTAHVG